MTGTTGEGPLDETLVPERDDYRPQLWYYAGGSATCLALGLLGMLGYELTNEDLALAGGIVLLIVLVFMKIVNGRR